MSGQRIAQTDVTIAGRTIGPGRPAMIVAELSGNHLGRIERALELIDAAAACGVDAVKLQTYTADTITLDCDAEPFRVKGTIWQGRTLHSLYREASTPWAWHERLRDRALGHGLVWFSSPFDDTAVDFLEELGVPAYKIASFELVDVNLIRRAARTGKPLVISTGMGSEEEIADAVAAARAGGACGVVLLKCTSAYPAKPGSMNLRTIPELSRRFGVAAGLSDHTLGSTASVVAAALGACLIEKHITLRRADGGPDAAFSLEPAEFARLVEDVRTAEAALGVVRFGPGPDEAAGLRLRRSLFVVRDVRAGEAATSENVRSIRPADGLSPRHLGAVLGRRFVSDAKAGVPLSWSLLGGEPGAEPAKGSVHEAECDA